MRIEASAQPNRGAVRFANRFPCSDTIDGYDSEFYHLQSSLLVSFFPSSLDSFYQSQKSFARALELNAPDTRSVTCLAGKFRATTSPWIPVSFQCTKASYEDALGLIRRGKLRCCEKPFLDQLPRCAQWVPTEDGRRQAVLC